MSTMSNCPKLWNILFIHICWLLSPLQSCILLSISLSGEFSGQNTRIHLKMNILWQQKQKIHWINYTRTKSLLSHHPGKGLISDNYILGTLQFCLHSLERSFSMNRKVMAAMAPCIFRKIFLSLIKQMIAGTPFWKWCFPSYWYPGKLLFSQKIIA